MHAAWALAGTLEHILLKRGTRDKRALKNYNGLSNPILDLRLNHSAPNYPKCNRLCLTLLVIGSLTPFSMGHVAFFHFHSSSGL